MDISQIASLFPQLGMMAQPQGMQQPMGQMPNQQQIGMSQFFDPNQAAQLQADQLKLQRNMQLANAFMQQGGQYAPNSGKVGILAGLASLIRGKVMQGQNETALKDVLGRQFQQDNQAAQAKRAQDLEDEQRKMYEEIFKGTETAKGKAKAERDFALPEVTNGLMIDRATGQSTAIPGWNDAAVSLERQKAKIEAANRQGPADPFAKFKLAVQQGILTPEQAQQAMQHELMGTTGGAAPSGYRPNAAGTGLEAIPGGPADPNQPRKPQPLSEAAANALAKINNALANAKEYQARTVGPKGEFKDWAANLNDTPQLMNSAVQDMLYAKSGANAPAAEVAKAQAMYAPGLLERDTTASAKVGNFIRDMERMRDQYTQGTTAEGSPEPQAFGGNPAAAGAPATPQGGHKVGDVLTVNGKQYRVTGGDPADPDLAPL